MATQKNKNLKWIMLAMGFFLPLSVQAEVVDRIIATVNQEPVTLYEFNKAMANIKKELDKQPNVKLSAEDVDMLKKKAFDHLVDELLLNQEITKKGLDVTDQDVTRAIDSILERNKFTMDQLRRELASKGEDIQAYREEIKSQLRRLKFINQIIGNKVHISDEDVKEYYAQQGAQLSGNQQIEIAQIVFPMSEQPSDSELKKVQSDSQEVYQKLKSGMKFDQAMKQYGGPGSGDLGKVNFSGVSPQIAQAIQALDKGQVTEPVRTQAGFIIVKLNDKPDSGQLAGSEEIKSRIRDRIYEIKVQEEMRKYVDQLRTKAFIDVKTTL